MYLSLCERRQDVCVHVWLVDDRLSSDRTFLSCAASTRTRLHRLQMQNVSTQSSQVYQHHTYKYVSRSEFQRSGRLAWLTLSMIWVITIVYYETCVLPLTVVTLYILVAAETLWFVYLMSVLHFDLLLLSLLDEIKYSAANSEFLIKRKYFSIYLLIYFIYYMK